MEFVRAPKRKLKLNLTPLIDLVFLLVVFFMLSSSFKVIEAVELGFGMTETGTGSDDSKTLVLTVRDDHRILLNDKVYETEEIADKLRRIFVQTPDKNVMLISDNGVNIQGVISAMDLVHEAGGHNITLAK
jgi:biopolymer transport protein ExbD